MKVLKIVLLILAILFLIATLVIYLITRKKIKKNDENLKTEILKYTKIYTIFLIAGGFLAIIGVIINIFVKEKLYTITLDINPAIELKINDDEIIKETSAINEDAIYIINGLNEKKLNEALDLMVERLIENKFVSPMEDAYIILYSESEIEIEEKIRNAFDKKEIPSAIIRIINITEEDKEFAKNHLITPAKAAYIDSVIQENGNITANDLINKPVSEIKEMKETGNYCGPDYTLDGSLCVKEIGRKPAKMGNVCENGYYLYNGKCYSEVSGTEGTKDECNDGFKIENGVCVLRESSKARGVCENDWYDESKDVCMAHEYIGDATEYCRDPGRTLYEHKCLATKPTINGGCLGKDLLYKGKCVNTRNDYYVSEWKCPGRKNSGYVKGEIMDEETHKCYKEVTSKPSSYECPEEFNLEGKTCKREKTEAIRKEILCPSGSTKVNGDRCIVMSNMKEPTNGYVCDYPDSGLKDGVCILYERVSAKQK